MSVMACGCCHYNYVCPSQSQSQWNSSSSSSSLSSVLKRPSVFVCVSKSKSNFNDNDDEIDKPIKGSGTTARGRRLLRIRQDKQQREHERLHNYPAWATVLEDDCKNDTELRAVLGDSIGNPQLMKERVEDRIRKKGKDFRRSKTGSVVASKVTFREYVYS